MSEACCVLQGFFVLRKCRNPAARVCSVCQRPVCEEHSRDVGGAVVCVDCKGRKAKVDPSLMPHIEDGRAWAFSYRHYYYRQSKYQPITVGAKGASYYDEYDVRAFDKKAGPVSEGLEVDVEGPDLLDS